MTDLDKNQSSKREKTMLISLLLSAPGPIVTGIPAITSLSATQIADFLRRTAELVALFVSWWIYRKLQRGITSDNAYRTRMEQRANLVVTGAMICSGIAMLIVGVTRLFVYKANGNVIMGLIIAVLGLLTNTWFWLRYTRMTRELFDPVIDGQQKLYRAKACVDLGVVAALTSVAVAPNYPATQYIDSSGCIIVACYLLYNGVEIIRKNRTKEGSVCEDLSELN
ncbi:MAG: putative rane transporter [Anaerocolumna sp.]|jgi:divalent metal cation (Fe/Co/Zn/Cd) transporter|nr:putative rane transporter [Anaerocolumna sp.]